MHCLALATAVHSNFVCTLKLYHFLDNFLQFAMASVNPILRRVENHRWLRDAFNHQEVPELVVSLAFYLLTINAVDGLAHNIRKPWFTSLNIKCMLMVVLYVKLMAGRTEARPSFLHTLSQFSHVLPLLDITAAYIVRFAPPFVGCGSLTAWRLWVQIGEAEMTGLKRG